LDVAWTYLTLSSPLIKAVYGVEIANAMISFNENYLNQYCNLSNIKRTEIINCLPIVAVRRLCDHLTCGNETSVFEVEWLKDLILI
jgi:hypothetical protein